MKKSSPLLVLGLVLFLWACSTTQEEDPLTPLSPVIIPLTTPDISASTAELDDFLEKVQGKVAYAHATIQNEVTKLGSFSEDGRSFFSAGLLGSEDAIKLEDVIDVNTVSYTFIDTSDNNRLYTFTMFTLDGITGTVSSEDPTAGIITTDAWLVTPQQL